MRFMKRRGSPVVVVTIGIALAIALAGCSAGNTPTSSTSNSTDSSAGVAAAKASVAKYSQENTEFTAPGDPITGVSALNGKKVMYIPANGVVPYFGVSFKGVHDALESVGVTASVCDAKANPSDAASCLNQAVSQGYAGVIIDSLPPVIAQQAFNAVQDAGIPILLLSQSIPDGSKATVQATGADYVQLTALAADVIIADSNGSAKILGVGVNDSPITIDWMKKGAEPEVAKNCAQCTINTIYTKTTDLQQLPSLVSAALLKNPAINYILPEFGAVLDGSIQGAQNASRTDTKIVSTTGGLENLQRVAKGSEVADVGFDLIAQGWFASDTLIRQMLKLPVDTTKTVITPRIFTKATVNGMDISQAGWENSSWYGGTGYQTKLKALWGAK